MQTIQLNQYSVDIHDNAGIMLSGGADSAVLFYILMKYSKTPIKVYTLASAEKFRANIDVTKRLIDYCMREFDVKQLVHHIQYEPAQTEQVLFRDAVKDVTEQKIKVLYTAITKCPPREVTDGFKEKNTVAEERDPSKQHPEYIFARKIYRPFYNLDKADIKNLYDELGILDTVFPLSRSCESLEIDTGHCGKCWWCEERQWAFGRLE